MLPANLDYAAPTSIADACALLTSQPDAVVVAGGYHTVIDLKMRRINPPLLIDLRKIGSLYGIQSEGDSLRIGIMTTLNTIMSDETIRTRYTALAEAAEASGDPQMRNMSALGSEIANGPGRCEVCAALLVLEALVHVEGMNGKRTLSAADFSTASLTRGEIVTAVSLPAPTGISAYEKIKHPATLQAVCGVAIRVTLDANNAVQTCAFAVTAATDQPTRLSHAEAALQGQPLTEDTIADAASIAGDHLSYRNDLDYSAEYRAQLVKVLLKRALTRLVS